MIALIALTILILIDYRIVRNPAKDMAAEIDLELAVKFQSVIRSSQIPALIFSERHQHIEDHLAVRDKWLSVMQWLGLISAAVVVLSGELIENKNISSWIKCGMYVFLIGFSIGAIWVRTGSAELKRLSFILKKAGERREADETRRRKMRRR